MRPERRRWGNGDKLAIVRETLAPGAVAQVVADRRGIGTGLSYTCCKQMLRAAMTGFTAAEMRPEALPAPQVANNQVVPVLVMPSKPPATPSLPSLIEVELPTRCGCGSGRTWTARRCGGCWRRLPGHDTFPF